MEKRNVPLEIKSVDATTGTFDGYASIFGNVDLGGDVIERGAFTEIVKNEDGHVVVLWQHRTDTPIATASIESDHKGLHFKGQLVLEDPAARKALAHMKAKSVRGMSIGFDILDGGFEMLEGGVRLLKKLKLWEISLVTFGMNPLAGVLGAKDVLGQITSIREYETFLRDVGGFSKDAAKILAAAYKNLPGQRDAEREAEGTVGDAKGLLSYLESVKTKFNPVST